VEFAIDKKENALFAIKVLCTVVVVIAAVVLFGSMAGLRRMGGALVATIIVYLVVIALFVWFQKVYLVAYLKGNGIPVTARQFPELHAAYLSMCGRLGLAAIPRLFVLQEGGLLNAFAVRFSGKAYIAVYSEIFSLLESDPDALRFVIGHELAHVKRRHMSKRFWTFPSSILPFLTPAYSRSCELTCDNFGAALAEGSPYSGMLLLAAGKELYKRIDVAEYLESAAENRSLAVRFVGLFIGHPYIPRRIANLEARAAGR
jgi:Zn-dependent protease with chaperone function